MRTKEEIRQEIFSLVKEYHEMEQAAKQPFRPGQKIPYCSRVYDEKEQINLVDSALEFWLTAGRFCREFEQGLGSFLGIKHVAAVNSGSSANLLAFMTLTSPLLQERAIRRGDEVICVAAAFPTSVTPILQYGAVPVFVDVELGTYNVDVSMLEKALSEKTKCVFLAHTLGNPFNLKAVKDFCDKHGLWLIEDNCDALGAAYDRGEGYEKTGTIGDLGTSSFYPAHHLTMGEGGAVYTNNDLLSRIMFSMRDWGRDCVCPPGMDDTCGHRFDGQYGLLPKGYDHKYVYSHLGYNLKITDMQAAVGCAQLKKLGGFVEKRRENWQILRGGLAPAEDKLILPYCEKEAWPSWFGFLLTVREGISREKVVKYIEDRGVQTRMLFSGNLLRHPCFDELRKAETGYRVVGDLANTDKIVNDTFWVGVYPGMTKDMLDYMVQTILEAVEEQ
ncbi:lipopolysaccharide biosynthesis protein RfbH [Acutalibacter sp. 1XD8-33]|uniref:lipopolysaccharide biosynthesis protein RfbH n=1 Tax=Acutalibacter sp. 1XD8-33 TaxID=2320081 RepID=UPI000EA21275|nr:lipopolysaccharide biosynthesis protein RfbH [Acutalibacter sp. 1XD8-33]RKJ42002.1 lipopolysaccharide biosynthesis protein RfbH [Acutalibacter sp. 1XD8-33]